ncbi:MAG: glycosyltransferase [Candidatus Omnitrophica bacterium]|nr:glycosyltransferase [Candidatus Omnitrophota bacterium]
MKKNKVLMISYLWPPMEDVGVGRALKFAKYLSDYNWEPVVLTIDRGDARSDYADEAGKIRTIKTDYVDVIEKIKSAIFFKRPASANRSADVKCAGELQRRNHLAEAVRELISIPDERIGWYKFAVQSGMNIIEKEGVDVIFSTSPPETANLIARTLKKKCHIPWVADLRDLWADDHYRQRHPFKKSVLRFMEKRVLKDADAVITVSEPWAETLRANSSGCDRVKVIENGFDEDEFSGKSYKKNDKLVIAYTGKLHKTYQPLEAFFKALRDLVGEGLISSDKIDVRFYVFGYDKPDIKTLAVRYGISSIVHEYGRTGREEALKIQRAADALLFVQWQGAGGDGWYSAKIYDYIGARRPILAIAKDGGIVSGLIKKVSGGIVADGEEALKNAILKLYDEYIKNSSVRYAGDENEVLKQTRYARTGELAGILNSVIKHG